jgi:hypothetical protein
MKSLITKIIAAVALPSAAFAINTYNVFTDVSGAIQFYQPGASVEITNSYSFEVGVFAAGTDFESATSIASNFKSFGDAVNWDPNLLDAGVGGASLSFSFDELGGYPNGITSATTLSIWVYDSKAPVVSSDWMILTNSNWVVQPLAVGAAVDSRDYTITDAGTTVRLGAISGNTFALVPAPAIPEPSTFAALAGFAVLGLAVSRRRRA